MRRVIRASMSTHAAGNGHRTRADRGAAPPGGRARARAANAALRGSGGCRQARRRRSRSRRPSTVRPAAQPAATMRAARVRRAVASRAASTPTSTIVDRGDDATIKIKVLREKVLDAVGYRPFEGDRRVFIIAGGRPPGGRSGRAAQDARGAAAVGHRSHADLGLSGLAARRRCSRGAAGFVSVRSASATWRACSSSARASDRAAASALAAVSGGSVTRALAEQSGDLGADRDAALAMLAAAKRGVARSAQGVRGAGEERLRPARSRGAGRAARRAVVAAARSRRDRSPGRATRWPTAISSATCGRFRAAFPLARVTAGYASLNHAQTALERNASPKIVADWVALHL